jgi:hypothetical protein
MLLRFSVNLVTPVLYQPTFILKSTAECLHMLPVGDKVYE